MDAACEIRVMGGFSVSVDGTPVSVDAWRNRRAADLVKLLAMAPQHSLHREKVMEALWPDLRADAAGANLRKSVHHARRVLESAGRLQNAGGLMVLCPDRDLVVDLDRFDQDTDAALGSGEPAACARVASTYGEVLPADRYEDWTAAVRDRAQARYTALLAAAGEWEKILELEPADEVAHRSLMQMHLDVGNRVAVIRQFERLRHELRDHLGVGPDQATVELYENALALEGAAPPSPAERVAALLAHGLVAWGRRELEEAERLAYEARTLSLDAGLGHELGEASSLLALIAFARGTWHQMFRDDLEGSMRATQQFEAAVYDGHVCFMEYFLCGPEGQAGADAFAAELMTMAEKHESIAGRALAKLLLGEFSLLSGDLDAAIAVLGEAAGTAAEAGLDSASSIALERLAESFVARGEKAAAREVLVRARPIAARSAIPSHLVIRLFGVAVLAAGNAVDAVRVVREAERWTADAPHVCEPCSMTFRIEAARTFVRAEDFVHARQFIADADRIAGMWQGGPWKAAVWEAQAELRRAEGQTAQASALFLEAAELFDTYRRPLDAQRCRAAAPEYATQT